MSHSIEVRVGDPQKYYIRTGMCLWEELIDYFASHYSDRKLFIVIDSKVNALHGQKIQNECSRYFKTCHILPIPEGEKSKSAEQWQSLIDELLAHNVERATPLLAVGGGVAGDLAGFAAATVLRGIPLIHMPTSLLAMVDSSIGGKTGINHSSGKNLVGAFYQPDAVFTDIEFLSTLARPEWIGGLAEILKYAAIREPLIFDEVERAVDGGFEPSEHWLKLIQRSATIKAEIVKQDVHEAGTRAYLNFGHTFGHALEKYLGYGNISHGEAVFTGMLAASYYSIKRGASVDSARFEAFKPLYNVHVPSNDSIPKLVNTMKKDKKVQNDIIRLVLLEKWGAPYIFACDDLNTLPEAWEAAFDALR